MTTDTRTNADFAARFVERLRSLSTGDAAMLRRDAGYTLAEAKRGMMVFYRLYGPPQDDRNEEIYFLVATLFALNECPSPGDFGRTMAALRDGGLSVESADRRLHVLLNSRFELIDGRKRGGGDLAYRLRQYVRLANSHNIGVDWPQLLRDLPWWHHPSKRVQKKWARSYFDAATELPDGESKDVTEGD